MLEELSVDELLSKMEVFLWTNFKPGVLVRFPVFGLDEDVLYSTVSKFEEGMGRGLDTRVVNGKYVEFFYV